MWKFSKKAKFCGNSPKKRVSVETCQKSKILWKYSNKAIFGGNFSSKLHISVKIFRHISVYFDGILPTKQRENFHKIHQTAKISAQQCCHAARVFVTLQEYPKTHFFFEKQKKIIQNAKTQKHLETGQN